MMNLKPAAVHPEIANSLDGRRIGSLIWKAYTLTSGRGRAAEEKRHGADIMGVLKISLNYFRIGKSFLAQDKLAEPFQPFPNTEWNRFQKQCKTMLDRTCDAFAVIHSRERGILFIPSQTILEINRDQLFDVCSCSLFDFFKSHVKCEIGDRNLISPSVNVLDRLSRVKGLALNDFGAETILSMEVTDVASS